MVDCVFCKIAAGETGSLIWESDDFVAFNDINPNANIHVLVVPRQHIINLQNITDPHVSIGLIAAIQAVTKLLGISEGYRVGINNGKAGGQDVFHLHAHVLSDKSK